MKSVYKEILIKELKLLTASHMEAGTPSKPGWLKGQKGQNLSDFFTFAMYKKCEFLTDVANKTITCYTFSVRSIILLSENFKIATKKINEEETEDFS